MKKFMLIAVLALFSMACFSQGTIAQFRKDGNKTWFLDNKTYNGFGTTAPTVKWDFRGAMDVIGNIGIGTTGAKFFTVTAASGNTEVSGTIAAKKPITVGTSATIADSASCLYMWSKDGKKYKLSLDSGGKWYAVTVTP